MTALFLLLAATFARPLERVSTMDPALSQTLYDSRAIRLVCRSVLDVDYAARPYRVAPGVCALPEVSADGLVYVFRVLDPECEAADVVRSLERLRDPALVSPNGWVLKSVDTIRATDARTVEIRLKQRNHVFPWLMTMTPAAVRKPDGSGTGPYVLEKWWKNHEMVFRRKPSHAKPGGFDTIRYLVIDDASTQWLMFLKGEVDYLGEISKDNWDAVLADCGGDPSAPKSWLANVGAYLYTAPVLEFPYVGVNMRDPVLGPNRKLRQALNCAFDFAAWRAFYANRVQPSTGPVPPGIDGRVAEPLPYFSDLAQAKRLVAEAGYPGGLDPKTGRRLTLTLSMGRASQDGRESAELIASFFARIGIRLEMRFYTWDAFLKTVNDGNVQLFRMGWVGDYPDAENFLQLFYSKNVSPGANHFNYVNPAYDREYDAAMAAPDRETRNAHWRRCQEILREDCPVVYTHTSRGNALVRPRVGNYIPSDFPYGQEALLECREPGK